MGSNSEAAGCRADLEDLSGVFQSSGFVERRHAKRKAVPVRAGAGTCSKCQRAQNWRRAPAMGGSPTVHCVLESSSEEQLILRAWKLPR